MSYRSREQEEQARQENETLLETAMSLTKLDQEGFKSLAAKVRAESVYAAATIVVLDRLPLEDVKSARMILMAGQKLRGSEYPRVLSQREAMADLFWQQKTREAINSAKQVGKSGEISGNVLFEILRADDIHPKLREEAGKTVVPWIEGDFQRMLWMFRTFGDAYFVTNKFCLEKLSYDELMELYSVARQSCSRDREYGFFPHIVACIEKAWQKGLKGTDFELTQQAYQRLPQESKLKLEAWRKALALAKNRGDVVSLLTIAPRDDYDSKEERRLANERMDELYLGELQTISEKGGVLPQASQVSTDVHPRSHKFVWEKEAEAKSQAGLAKLAKAKEQGYEAVRDMPSRDRDCIYDEWQEAILSLATTADFVMDSFNHLGGESRLKALKQALALPLTFNQRCCLIEQCVHREESNEILLKLCEELLWAVQDDIGKAQLLYKSCGYYSDSDRRSLGDMKQKAFSKLVDCLAKAKQRTALKELYLKQGRDARDSSTRLIVLRGLISLAACEDDLKDLELTFNRDRYSSNRFNDAELIEFGQATLKFALPEVAKETSARQDAEMVLPGLK